MPTAFCANHPDLEAVARCKGCRKLLCNKCRKRGHDGWYCSDTCLKKQAGQQQIVQAHDQAKRRGGLVGKLVPVAVILAVAGAAYWLFIVQGVRSVADLQALF